MFSFTNRTLFNIPSTWNRTHFKTSRSKYQQARKLIQISINVQFERELKAIQMKNRELEKKIIESNEHLSKHEKQVNIFNDLTEIASESLTAHFDKRKKNIQTMVEKHVQTIQTLFQNENQYWKDLHSAINQSSFPANNHPSVENLKAKHPGVVLPSINKSYFTNFEEITNRLSSIESCPTYSPPKSPAPLYFSPTILQDESSENMRIVHSPVRQTQTSKDPSSDLMTPRIIIHRIDPGLLIDYLNKQENNDIKPRTISLRRRKSRKRSRNRKVNKKKILIRVPSPLRTIDRSKHYHTRFSTRN